MRNRTAVSKKPATYIAPERLYSLAGFQQAAGIASTRMREARLQGITPLTLKVGKRIFIRGVDGIDYIERLSQLPTRLTN